VVFMNTTVTRGRAEFVVTATGMDTEIGRIAGMLHETEPEPTPLQRQIDALSRTLALIAGGVIVVVFVLGLVRGQDLAALFVSAVSLAVAAIPEGLPAVVAFTLAMGTTRLARQGAIVKRLASVETLGSTSQVCTDKTGTLTLNQMTAQELRMAGPPPVHRVRPRLLHRRPNPHHGRVAPARHAGRDDAVHRQPERR
jgi:P-type Ca2+ transporter type 2C